MRGRLGAIWTVSPQLTAGNSHEWWNPFATSGLSRRAPEDVGNELSKKLHEMLIFSSEDLAQLGARQLHLISGNPESNRLTGQLRRAVRVAGDTTDFRGGAGSPHFVTRERGAFKLAEAVAAGNASTSESGKIFSERASQLVLAWGECEASMLRQLALLWRYHSSPNRGRSSIFRGIWPPACARKLPVLDAGGSPAARLVAPTFRQRRG